MQNSEFKVALGSTCRVVGACTNWLGYSLVMSHRVHNVDEVLKRLRKGYGAQPARTWGRGIDFLVETILSQNTSNRISAAAYRQLRRRCKTWDQVADAPVEEVERW